MEKKSAEWERGGEKGVANPFDLLSTSFSHRGVRDPVDLLFNGFLMLIQIKEMFANLKKKHEGVWTATLPGLNNLRNQQNSIIGTRSN